MTFDTNRPLRASLIFLPRWSAPSPTRSSLSSPTARGWNPTRHYPLEGAQRGGVNIQFGLGELSNYEHFARPYIVWTLGDTKQRGALHRNRGIVNLRPFKQTLDLVTCTMYGANIDNSDRGTVTGCERLRWCFYWGAARALGRAIPGI